MHSDIKRSLFVELDLLSSFEWSHGQVDRSIYNSLSDYQNVRKREFIHRLAFEEGLML